MSVAANLGSVRQEIAAAELAFGRQAGSVLLVSVSKLHSAEEIRDAIDAGQRHFGENRVQEAAAKFPALREACPDLLLHLIGPLQTNKVKDAVRLFDIIETVDRPRLAEALAVALREPGVRTRQVLVQVNTGEEAQKAGILPLDADAFIRDCIDRLMLPVGGLMCIPPVDEEPSLHFALLREMAKRHALPVLSMGMSGDYRLAIQQGTTHVRIGTAIFGARAPV